MAATAVLSSRDVPTTLNYYTPTAAGKPYHYVEEPPAGKPKTNVGQEPHSVLIHNARGREDEFGLDKSGFQFVKWPSVEREFDDEERIKSVYYPEVEELLKRSRGQSASLSSTTLSGARSPKGQGQRAEPRARATGPHRPDVQCKRRARQASPPEDADRLLKSRVRIINVWRPIHHPVAHFPLAVSDWRHLDEKDLVPSDLIYPTRTGGTYSTPEAVTLIKCYDSEEDRARLTPHSAFADESSPADAPHRESIEIRALVFDSE
ncbi:uncharacterized protein BXZ73DRAFT_108331 [Epithele typhae]|uniref:uncharacterized protein n=1 Tax=Epithele typhae TaxID=378194 RepID=UPI0020089D56|nr:uncharacterized protein BXZ73DRAFT_108331 [Epithele typhae]KAH9910967.1 hypothetical protein BXZ73DRAFT_108331 [Epithele typhae]